jgi:hypothetical protein
VHLIKSDALSVAPDGGPSVRVFLMACHTFVSNVVERFHEYADARLAEELTIVEQRRRMLTAKRGSSQKTAPSFTRAAHVD